ncbi:MAG: ABC transporter substrate-binding protein [Caldilineaceae bacterium]|nr:ABC transporter substrate-binding protein [Caldilineaceae bacterium]
MTIRNNRLVILIASALALLAMAVAGCAAPAAPAAEEPAEEAPAEAAADSAAAAPAGDWYTEEQLNASWINVCTDVAPKQGGTVTLAQTDIAMQGQNWIVRASTNDEFIFSQLTDLAMNGQDIVPDVAESWDISDDGLTYTYNLRDDVLWHDGEPLTAADVKWTIEMLYHPDTGAGVRTVLPLFVIAGADEFAAGDADEISGVQVIDDTTVEITLSESRADFFYGMGGMNLFPQHVFEGVAFADIQSSPNALAEVIGSGPFMLTEYEPDQYYILEAFEDYYKGRPYLDRLIFRIGLDSVASWLPGLEAGEIQVGNMVNGPDRNRVEEDENLTVVGAPLPGAMAIWPNHDNFPDKRVLQALIYAVDREAIVQGIYGEGQALVYDYTAIDPGATWIDPDVPQYPYDPEMATQLLEEAGWDFDQELQFVTYYQSELDRRVVAAMQQFWNDVGVKVNVEHMDGPTFVTRFYEEHDFDLGYGCCGVASPFEYPRYTCSNMFPAGYNGSRYCNAQVDDLVMQSMVEPDPDTRKNMWYELSMITNEEVLHMTMFQQDRRHAINQNVCNYQFRQWTNIIWPETNPETWYLAD